MDKDLSRLGRNSAMTGLYTTLTFPKYGTRFIAINDNFDSADPNSVNNDFAGIKNWFIVSKAQLRRRVRRLFPLFNFAQNDYFTAPLMRCNRRLLIFQPRLVDF